MVANIFPHSYNRLFPFLPFIIFDGWNIERERERERERGERVRERERERKPLAICTPDVISAKRKSKEKRGYKQTVQNQKVYRFTTHQYLVLFLQHDRLSSFLRS